jgi:hypothetical protein
VGDTSLVGLALPHATRKDPTRRKPLDPGGIAYP